MILLNFTHPLIDSQRAPIAALTASAIRRVIVAMPQFGEQQPFALRLAGLLAHIDLTPGQWQFAP